MSTMRTATETLMEAMNQFGDSEPKECLIIWTDENGDISWSSTTGSLVLKKGLVDYMRTIFDEQVRDQYRNQE